MLKYLIDLEGKHTNEDIMKLKERLIVENSIDDPMDVPHLFIQNKKVNEFNKSAQCSNW